MMALQVIELDHDPTALSLVATCLGAGLVAFVLVGGIAADRIHQRAIIIAVEAVNTVAVSAVAVLGLAWRSCGSGTWPWRPRRWASPRRSSSPPTAPSCRGSCLPNSCWPPTESRASCARCSSARSAPRWPASWSSVRRSRPLGAVAVAALFAVGLRAVWWPPRPATDSCVAEPAHEQPHMLRDLRDGFAFMLRTPWLLWTLLFASMFVLVVIGPIEVLLPFIAQERFEDGERCTASSWRSSGGRCARRARGVVAAAAAALPDGDDACGGSARCRWWSSARRPRSR